MRVLFVWRKEGGGRNLSNGVLSMALASDLTMSNRTLNLPLKDRFPFPCHEDQEGTIDREGPARWYKPERPKGWIALHSRATWQPQPSPPRLLNLINMADGEDRKAFMK